MKGRVLDFSNRERHADISATGDKPCALTGAECR